MVIARGPNARNPVCPQGSVCARGAKSKAPNPDGCLRVVFIIFFRPMFGQGLARQLNQPRGRRLMHLARAALQTPLLVDWRPQPPEAACPPKRKESAHKFDSI